jgi:hypothetical protein
MTKRTAFIAPPVVVLRRFSAVLAMVIAVAPAAPARAQAPGATSVPESGPPAPAPVPAPAPGAPVASPPPGWVAQQPPPGWPPPQGVPPASAYPQPNGEYVAPLSQQTQPVYIPQSVALSGPRMIRDWQDGDPIPWGYHREERVRKGEIIPGALVFGIPYIYSSLIGSIGSDISGHNDLAWLYVPVLGPFIELKDSSSNTLDELLIIDGVAQAVGAYLLIHGLTVPKAVLVRNDLAMNVMVTPAPMGKDGTGFALVGRF